MQHSYSHALRNKYRDDHVGGGQIEACLAVVVLLYLRLLIPSCRGISGAIAWIGADIAIVRAAIAPIPSIAIAVAGIGTRALVVHSLLSTMLWRWDIAVLRHCHAASIHRLHGVHCLGRHHLALVHGAGMWDWRPDLAPLLPCLAS